MRRLSLLTLLLFALPAAAADPSYVGANALTTPAQKVKGVWYVSTSSSLTDHGTTASGTVAWAATQTGDVIDLPGNTTYPFLTSWTCSGKTLQLHAGTTISVASGKTVDLTACNRLGDSPTASGSGTLLAGGASGTLVVWEADKGRVVQQRPYPAGVAAHIRFSKDGRTLTIVGDYSGGTYPAVEEWEVETVK